MPTKRTYGTSVSTDGKLSLSAAEVATYYRQRVPNLKQTTAGEWRGPCPIHGGKNDSFAVDAGTGKWCCHSKCDRGGDVFALERELSGSGFPAAKRAVLELVGRVLDAEDRVLQWKPTAEYVYRDEAGNPLFRVERMERGTGPEKEKKFHQSRLVDGQWVTGIKGVRRIPYRLPELLAAEKTEPVLICEGEKDVDRLAGLGYLATCNPMGAGKAKLFSEWLDYFRGRYVVIIPDNDPQGRKHAVDVAEILLPVVSVLTMLELPGLAEKGDVSDWLDNGGTAHEFNKLAIAAPLIDVDGLAALRERWGLTVEEPGAEASERVGPKSPFRVTERGVFWLKGDGDGGVEPVWLSDTLEILADTQEGGKNWGRMLRWHDPAGQEHTWPMPVALLAGDAVVVRGRLMDGGLRIATNAKLREKLMEYLQSHPSPKRLSCVSRTGWAEGNYVLPGWNSRAAGAAEVVYQHPGGDTGAAWGVAGTWQEWRDGIGRYCVGNYRLILAVSIAFAGPLLRQVKAESGGFHYVGTSSCGKTTTLYVGSSVCGGGQGSGFVQSWRATGNGLEALAVSHNDAALFLDEIGQLDPHEAANAAYTLANGRGKVRMTKSLQAPPPAEWRLLFCSSGELTLSDHAAAAGVRTKAGVSVRCLNIPADAGRGYGLFDTIHDFPSAAEFADELKRRAGRWYGSVFREHVRLLVENPAAIRVTVDECRKAAKRWVPKEANGEVGRAAERFAIVAAGGTLASRWKLTGWPDGAALEAAERCFYDWLRERGTAGGADAEAGVRAVRLYLQQHGGSRFQHIRASEASVINRVGFWREENDTVQYLVLAEVFRSEICKGFNAKAVAEELRMRGYLVHEDNRLTLKPRLPGLGTTRVYCIREAIMDSEAAED